jgi:hypothetical protein
MSDQPKKRVGDYEILSELGRGGMGRVYRVRNVISDRIEAMKILLPELAGRQELTARFLREIKLLASLDHPNIGALRTALMVDDQFVMIMEFVEGTTLEERLEQGPLPIPEALEYTDQVLQALSYAHKRGVVHRDIKPANMMLTADGIIKVMDFGIAFAGGSEQRLTSTGTTMGSLPYMSPEQVRGEAADPRSDLYSVGVSLYEMVTGRRPFAADSDFAVMVAHVKETPRPPIEYRSELPPKLNAVILRALVKEKEGRFQSADEFGGALSGTAVEKTAVFTPALSIPVAVEAPQTVKSQALPAPPAAEAAPPPEVQAPRRSSHRGLYMGLGAVLALAVLVAAGTYYRSGAAGSKPSPPPAPAVEEQPAEAPPAPATAPTTVPESAPAPPLRPATAPATHAVPSSPPAEQATKVVEEAVPVVDNSAELEALERQIDNLTSRAFAVDSNLETLRAQQRAAGYDLRGDVVANWGSMKLNLTRAQQALAAGNLAQGKKYADLTENYLGQLERFLGR